LKPVAQVKALEDMKQFDLRGFHSSTPCPFFLLNLSFYIQLNINDTKRISEWRSFLALAYALSMQWTNKFTSKWNQTWFSYLRKHHASKLEVVGKDGQFCTHLLIHPSLSVPATPVWARAYCTYLPHSEQPASTFSFNSFSFSMTINRRVSISKYFQLQ
jgi:hypothetical protein